MMVLVVLGAAAAIGMFLLLRGNNDRHGSAREIDISPVAPGGSVYRAGGRVAVIPAEDLRGMITALNAQAAEMRAVARKIAPPSDHVRARRKAPNLSAARLLLTKGMEARREAEKVEDGIIIDPPRLEREFHTAIERHVDACDDLDRAIFIASDDDA